MGIFSNPGGSVVGGSRLYVCLRVVVRNHHLQSLSIEYALGVEKRPYFFKQVHHSSKCRSIPGIFKKERVRGVLKSRDGGSGFRAFFLYFSAVSRYSSEPNFLMMKGLFFGSIY